MRAKQNFKIKLLICCLTMLLMGTLLVACNEYVPDHYDHLVTFCYNLGDDISGNAPDVYLGLLDPDGKGSLVSIRPGYNSSTFSEASISGYYIEGWYEAAEIDENGEPKRNEKKDGGDGRVVLGKKFDFTTDRVDHDITLYANLVKSPRMYFWDASTGKKGEKVGEIDGRRPGESRSKPSGSLAPQKVVDGEPYTFMGEYYADEECTEPFNFPYEFQDGDVDVYCKFIKGEWALVDDPNDFNNAVSGGQNIYLMNDIDFTGQMFISQIYNGELNGNGYTVRGVALNYADRSAITTRTQRKVGVFQVLMGRAYVHDVTFEDVTINVELRNISQGAKEVFQDAGIGSLAAEAWEGARVENVKISGTITCNEYTRQCVEYDSIALHPFIPGLKDADYDKIVNCDYSGVKVIYLS